MATLSIDDVLSLEYPGVPFWSTDGRYVATVIQEPDSDSVLFSEPSGDTKWRYRPDDQDTVAAATWGPGAPECLIRFGSGRIICVNPQSKSARIVATGRPESHHTWSSNGDRMAFYQAGTLCVRNIEESATHTLEVDRKSVV